MNPIASGACTVQDRRVQKLSVESGRPTRVGALATAAMVVPGHLSCATVGEVLRVNRSLPGVVVDDDGAPVLLTRSTFEALMSGPLGWGRLLHGDRPIVEVAPTGGLVMEASSSLVEAASMLIEHGERLEASAPELFVVRWSDVRLGLGRSSEVFQQVARDAATPRTAGLAPVRP